MRERVGVGPTRFQSVEYRPARVTACVLVFIPEQFGYYQQRLDILKICLGSIIEHTPRDAYDLLVFDNGSCPEVLEYLRSLYDENKVQYLLLSRANVGVANAFRTMFSAAPGEVIAYCDDDVLFYPGWLEAHLEILDGFPQVGMVSGCCGEQIGIVAKDVVVEHDGLKAWSTAKHYQFVANKSVILQGIDPGWEERVIGSQTRKMDKRIDALGYSRLTTFERYVQHMGNVLPPELLASIPSTISPEPIKAWTEPRPLFLKLAGRRFARSSLRRLNNWSYNLLNAKVAK